jgi:hypothetical protein
VEYVDTVKTNSALFLIGEECAWMTIRPGQYRGKSHQNGTIFRTRTSFRAVRVRGKGVKANASIFFAVGFSYREQRRLGMSVFPLGSTRMENAGASCRGAIEAGPGNPFGDAAATGRDTVLA